MFIHKIKQSKNPKKVYTNYKYLYKTRHLYSILNNINSCYIFFYTSFSKQKEIELKNLLQKENLKFIKLKKNLLQNEFNNSKFNFINNLLKNNIMLVYNTNSPEINNVLISDIVNLKIFNLFGIWSNQKFLRPSEIKQLSTLNQKNLNLELLSLNNFTKNYFFKTLSKRKVYA